MFKEKLTIAFLVATAWTSLAMAGAVSGGGGGTTNPAPADPEWIVLATGIDSGKIMTSWFNRQEELFELLNEREKTQSPYFKIFRGRKSIFEIIKQTAVEVRMSAPCYDANGDAKDGSIYASRPGAICISPFTMAPKLNEYNVKIETVALIVHELTHLAGTDEQEAESIQRDAIWSFYRLDFFDVTWKLKNLSEGMLKGMIDETIVRLYRGIQRPEDLQSDLSFAFWRDLLQIREDLDYNHKDVSFLRDHHYKLIAPYLVKISAIHDFVCSNDAREDQASRAYCLEQLNKGYGADSVVTARQFIARQTETDPSFFDAEFDQVSLLKITGFPVISSELTDIANYLRVVQKEVRTLNAFNMSLYRTP